MESYWTSVLTPPVSDASLGSISEHGSEDGYLQAVSMSSIFYPKDGQPYDLVIISSDNVLFALEKIYLLTRSTNYFGGFLDNKACQSFMVEEDSNILNLIVCSLYNVDLSQFRPSVDDYTKTLASLEKYGIILSELVVQGSSIYNSILTLAISRPLEIYALICQYGLEALAVQISRHLLSVSLSDLTDDLCLQMGAIYLRRLVFLHLGRTERLKILLEEPPPGHSPVKECDALDQKCKLIKGWRDTVISLTWDIGPNTPIPLIHHRLHEHANTLVCQRCQTSTKERIRSLVLDWATVKSTI